MKKALAVLLSVLAIFSMFSVVAFAEDATDSTEATLVTVEYYDDEGKLIKTLEAAPGTVLNGLVPANPVKQDTDTTRYTFKGWRCDFDGELYYENTQVVFQSCEPGSTLVFRAEFSKENIESRQTFWNLIESIFERFNLIFAYFAKVFEW